MSLLDTKPAAAAVFSGRRRTFALLTVVGASVMDMLDGTIVSIAGPALRHDIGASASALQWIMAGYTLAFAAGLITGGRLGDVLGRKRLFLIGVAGFVASSAVCSAAVNPQMLIASRVVQGTFAALMVPQVLGMIRAMYPGEQMAKAFMVFGPVMGIGATAAPVIGGALVSGNLFGLGWRAIFLLNVPIGLAALAGAALLVPADSRARSRAPRLDLAGMVLATGAVLLLIYPLVQGREAGWPAWMLVMMAASVPAFGIFVLHQRARQRAGRDPLVETSIWHKREFCSGTVFVMLFFGCMTGLFFALTLFLQIGAGFSPLHAGLTTLPWSVGLMVSMGAAEGLTKSFGPRRTIQAGVLIMAAGIVGAAFTIHAYGLGTSSYALIPALAVAGFGMGLVFGPFFGTVLAAVEDHEVGSAAGVVEAVQQLGSAFGIAGLGTLFFDRIPAHGAVGATIPVFGITAGVLAVAWAIAFLMPKTARSQVG
jgi:EmrB/QacA subfamily drug resistance transporter